VHTCAHVRMHANTYAHAHAKGRADYNPGSSLNVLWLKFRMNQGMQKAEKGKDRAVYVDRITEIQTLSAQDSIKWSSVCAMSMVWSACSQREVGRSSQLCVCSNFSAILAYPRDLFQTQLHASLHNSSRPSIHLIPIHRHVNLMAKLARATFIGSI